MQIVIPNRDTAKIAINDSFVLHLTIGIKIHIKQASN